MYRKNLPITTGKLPAKINSFNCSKNNSIFSYGIHKSKKGSRFPIAAFLLLMTAFLTSACEEPGPVGEDIITGEEPVQSQTVYLQDYTLVEENAFSGRLANTAVGYFDDPVYGTMKSVALLKPSISTSDVDTVGSQDALSLQLIFSDSVYGDSLATSTYEIYEAAEIWRGAELRYNQEIPIDMSHKIAEFQVDADEDSLVIDLSREFVTKYAEYFNADTSLTTAERDSIYIYNFPGLAIVPSESNQNIRFLKTLPSNTDNSNDEEAITSFFLTSPDQDDEEDDGPVTLFARDWGVSFTRQTEPTYPNNIVLHNTERILKFQLDLPKEELQTKNIVFAQLVFSKDSSPVEGTPQIKRPNTNFIRGHVFNEEPNDVMAEIFISEPNYIAALNDTSNAFLMDITQHVLNKVYGDAEDRIMYVSIQSVNGLFYSSHFFDPNSADVKKPRVVITYVEE